MTAQARSGRTATSKIARASSRFSGAAIEVHRVDGNCDFTVALALLEKKNYEELRSYALPYAQVGDFNAQCLIGFIHHVGLGVRVFGPSRTMAA